MPSISAAVAIGVQICFDETHGYNRNPGHREMNPDCDCSYFVWYCLNAAGFSVGSSGFDTTSEGAILRAAGFTETVYTSSFVPQHGDIFMYDEGGGAHGHTFFYAENVQGYVNGYQGWSNCNGTVGNCSTARVEASDYHGHSEPGDQDNGLGAHTEVWSHTYNQLVDPSHTWYVYRYGSVPPPPPPTVGRSKLPIWLIHKITNRKEL